MPDGFWPPQLNFPPDHSWKPVKPTEQLKLSRTETKKPLKRVKPLKPLNGGRAAHICGDKQRKWKLLIGGHQLSAAVAPKPEESKFWKRKGSQGRLETQKPIFINLTYCHIQASHDGQTAVEGHHATLIDDNAQTKVS